MGQLGGTSLNSLIIGGDLAPIGRSHSLFECGDVSSIFGDLLPILRSADIVAANLECPLLDEGHASAKTGPSLKASPRCVAGLTSAGIRTLCLSNNHIMDFGAVGLKSTLAACEDAGIVVFGAGRNIREARKLVVREVGGFRIGFWGMAEREWSVAGKDTPGANPLDVMAFRRMIRASQDSHDFLVVFVHGGKEFYPYPTPRLMDTCRFLAEEGADAVVCQHTHCPGCYEHYEGVPIIYGQGNFVFDRVGECPEVWHEGFLVELDVNGRDVFTWKFIPFEQSLDAPGVKRLKGERELGFLDDLNRRAREIQEPGFVEERWKSHCRSLSNSYLTTIRGYSRAMNFAARSLPIERMIQNPGRWRSMLNIVRCETHREVLESVLTDELERK